MIAGTRVFKFKTLDRWAKGLLTDADLCKAAAEVLAGHYEADLGGGLCKKRVAVAGRGKSGSTRTLIAQTHRDALFFVAGRQKSDPGADFTDREIAVAKVVTKGLQRASDQQLVILVAAGSIKEICNGPEAEPSKKR